MTQVALAHDTNHLNHIVASIPCLVTRRRFGRGTVGRLSERVFLKISIYLFSPLSASSSPKLDSDTTVGSELSGRLGQGTVSEFSVCLIHFVMDLKDNLCGTWRSYINTMTYRRLSLPTSSATDWLACLNSFCNKVHRDLISFSFSAWRKEAVIYDSHLSINKSFCVSREFTRASSCATRCCNACSPEVSKNNLRTLESINWQYFLGTKMALGDTIQKLGDIFAKWFLNTNRD